MRPSRRLLSLSEKEHKKEIRDMKACLPCACSGKRVCEFLLPLSFNKILTCHNSVKNSARVSVVPTNIVIGVGYRAMLKIS